MCAKQNKILNNSKDGKAYSFSNSQITMSHDKLFLNFDEACSYLSFTKNRMSDLIDNNKIPYSMFMNSYYFKKSNLDAWFNWILNSVESCDVDWDDNVANLPDFDLPLIKGSEDYFEYSVVDIDKDNKTGTKNNEVVWISSRDKRRLYKWLLRMNDRRHIFVKYNENDFNCLFTDFFNMDSAVVKEYDECGLYDLL